MDARCSALDDFRRHEQRQVLQPQTGALDLAVPELPWLHGLCRLLIVADALLRVPVHDRVLDRDALDRRVPQVGEQRGALVKFAPHILQRPAGRRNGQPADAAVAKPRAGRMRHDHQIPAVVENVPDIADDVLVRSILGRQQIAGPSIMAAAGEGSTDDARELAGNENAKLFHAAPVGVDNAETTSHPRRIRLLTALRSMPKCRHHPVIVFVTPSIVILRQMP